MDPVLPLNFSIRESDFPEDHHFLWEGIRILSRQSSATSSKIANEPTEILEITEKVILSVPPTIPWQMRGEQLHRARVQEIQATRLQALSSELTGKILNFSLETIFKSNPIPAGPSQSLNYFLAPA